MKLRRKLYCFLVNRNPCIRKRYQEIRRTHTGRAGRLYAWLALTGLQFCCRFSAKDHRNEVLYPDEHKALPKGRSESSLSVREAPEKLAERLAGFDVISFDLFDTCILRIFEQPADVFFLTGEQLDYPDFRRIREEMEEKARRNKQKKEGHGEVTLQEIYTCMEQETGIPIEEGMQAEIEAEKKSCFGNPYFLAVIKELRKKNKTVIASTDMYLPEEVVRSITEGCGYAGFDRYFVSCEQGTGKSSGGLFQKVKEAYGESKTYVHIGDNPFSDGEQAKKQGFETVRYVSVKEAGKRFRAEDLSVITGSLYRGVVNAHIHNGFRAYSQAYELGFIYGGLLVLGYCRFIHEYAVEKQLDKILFFSRDGDILNQVYRMLYPPGEGEIPAAYVYWSRLAAAKMTAGYYRHDYFRRFLYHKADRGYSMKQIFASMELKDLLEDCICMLKRQGKETEKLTGRNVETVKEFLMEHWQTVLSRYEQQTEAGRRYYETVLRGCQKVAAVDAGWAGSGAIALQKLVQEVWGMDCEITGILAGTNTVHNAEPDMSEHYFYTGRLVSYLFSQSHNRDLWKYHDAGKGHNLGIELLLSSVEGSLQGFYLTEGSGCEVRLKSPDADRHLVEEIQRGIRDFVSLAEPAFGVFKGKGEIQISGRDAYAPIRLLFEKHKEIDQWVGENLAVDI